ncbi:urease accessory protein UreD [Microbacterium sp. zg.Y625]|nr:urease accessory protein UreD [Microbacterium sp. zg.Y625]
MAREDGRTGLVTDLEVGEVDAAMSAPEPLYGGPRLQPAHFEPEHVPIEVARYGTESYTLPVGSPGKVGILELGFELRGQGDSQRTELVHHYQKAPLQIMKPLYYNTLRPDMPYTYLITTGGGILHNDRQRMDLTFGQGTSAFITTQAHTKVYRMVSGYATSIVNIDVAEGAYVEYLPDPLIPYVDSRFYQQLTARVHPDATLLVGETVYAGRLTRGERYAFGAYASDLEVRRPDDHGGEPVAIDRVRLVPRDGRVGGDAVLGGRDIVSSLYVVTPLQPAARVAAALHDAVAKVVAASADDSVRFGVSVLPADAGAWLRYAGNDTVTSLAVHTAAAAAVHELLTGRPAPLVRK